MFLGQFVNNIYDKSPKINGYNVHIYLGYNPLKTTEASLRIKLNKEKTNKLRINFGY